MGQGDETYMLEARLERQHMESEVLLNVIRSHASTTDTDDFPDAVHRARRRLCGFWDRCSFSVIGKANGVGVKDECAVPLA